MLINVTWMKAPRVRWTVVRIQLIDDRVKTSVVGIRFASFMGVSVMAHDVVIVFVQIKCFRLKVVESEI